MKYQFIRLTNNGRERVQVIDCTMRREALDAMSEKAKEIESILYLLYFDEKYPEWHDAVIATASHKGEIVNY